LSYLNRDLSKVVTLDTHEEHVSTHPENALVVPKWNGDPQDRGLIALIPFLECLSLPILFDLYLQFAFDLAIGIYKPGDVRPILQAYAGKDVPVEYAKKEAEAKAKHIEEWKKSGKGLATGGFTLSGLFGLQGSVSLPSYDVINTDQSFQEASSSPVPLTYLEQKRKEAQLLYKEEQAYIQSHKADFERLLAEERKTMAKEMSGSLWGALDALYGGRPTKNEEEPGKEHAQADNPPRAISGNLPVDETAVSSMSKA
jgi:import inner membrane translocase subunit TIM50